MHPHPSNHDHDVDRLMREWADQAPGEIPESLKRTVHTQMQSANRSSTHARMLLVATLLFVLSCGLLYWAVKPVASPSELASNHSTSPPIAADTIRSETPYPASPSGEQLLHELSAIATEIQLLNLRQKLVNLEHALFELQLDINERQRALTHAAKVEDIASKWFSSH